jgi:cytosine deaminase
MTSQSQMRACFDAVTVNAARVLGLPCAGVAVGEPADLVLLQARDPVEAIRLRARRLLVLRNGRVISRCAPRQVQLSLPGREPPSVDWLRPARAWWRLVACA